jgi:hypothetical protein
LPHSYHLLLMEINIKADINCIFGKTNELKFMKKKLFLLAASFLVITSQAQNRIEKSGTPVNKDNTPIFTHLIGSDNAFFYTLRIDKNIGQLYQGKCSIDKLSKTNLNFVERISSTSHDTRTDDFPSPIMLKEKIFLLLKFNNKSNKTCDYILDIINTNVANKTPERRVLISFPTDQSSWYQSAFKYSISPDSSKIGVIAKYKDDLSYYLYSAADFKEISNKKITTVGTKIFNSNFQKMNFKIDNEGNLFYCRMEAQTFTLNQISSSNNSFSTCSFKLNPTYDMGDINYMFDTKNNQILVHSTFYEKNSNPKIKGYNSIGIYISKVDKKDMKVSAEKYYPFTTDIIEKIACGKLEKGINSERSYSSDIILTENSEILFEAEQNSMAAINRGSNAGSMYDMSTRISFGANEIIVAKLGSNLDLTWMKEVPRSTTYTNITNKTESSIVSTRLFANEKLKYYFIEHPKFEDTHIDYLTVNTCATPDIKSYPGTNVVEYSLDKTGKLEKRIIFTNKKEWLLPVFYNVNLGKNKHLARFRDGDKEYFSIINLD